MSLPAALLNENNALASLSKQAGTNVTNAIYSASQKTGVDFGYLMKQASVESSFDTDAQAKTSSARGLYQFIESTWLDMVKKHGAKYGIDTTQSRSALLALRDDPKISAQMAAEYAENNQNFLNARWAKGEKDIGATELYLAHFMGAGGAASFLKAKDANPLQPAAELFEKAANANKSIFFDPQTKRARTLQEVYDRFDAKFQDIKVTDSSAHKTPDTFLKTFDDSFAQYASAAANFFNGTTFPNAQITLDKFFTNDNKTMLNSQKLWAMNSVDFVRLWKDV